VLVKPETYRRPQTEQAKGHFMVYIWRPHYRSFIMSKPQDRTISQRTDGKWENKRNDSDRASSVHDTQAEAQQAARQMLQNQGGGEMTTKGRDGQFRAKDTIDPGNDPRNIKG
jgi:hypothetical protein